MKTKLCIILLSTLLVAGCNEKFSGTSDESFGESRLKVESTLNDKEKEKLEKALRLIVLQAIQVKFDEAEQYKDKSFEIIALEMIDGKTYAGIVRLAERFLAKKNDKDIVNLKERFAKLQAEKETASETIAKLTTVQPTNIMISSSSSPTVEIIFTNTGELELTADFMFHVDINSLAKGTKIDSTAKGGSFNEGTIKKKGDYFTTVTRSLSSLMDRSKMLTSGLGDAEYPITELALYDLDVQAYATKITTVDGTTYQYPAHDIASYEQHMEQINKEIAFIDALEGALDEYNLTDVKTENIDNKYAAQIEEIRNNVVSAEIETYSVKINDDLTMTLPKAYEFKEVLKNNGVYSLGLNEDLIFSNSDESFKQFKIKDISYEEYAYPHDKANGYLDTLQKGEVDYDITKAIALLKKTGYFDIVDTDDSGYIHHAANKYRLFRYFKIKDIHYVYSLNFNNLAESIAEFDRSRNMIN